MLPKEKSFMNTMKVNDLETRPETTFRNWKKIHLNR